jgi:anti-sigma factor ChrR (cupin superfamily)
MTTAPKKSADTVEQTGKLSRPVSGSVVRRSTMTGDWEASGTTGFSYQQLFADQHTGQRIMLMKVEPGGYSPPHAHDELEQILVVEGECYDDYGTYGPGDFIVRAAGADHAGGTENGAVLLLIYS